MNFKSKIKCLFEQAVIACVLFLVSMVIYSIIESVFGNFFKFLPDKVYYFAINFLYFFN